MTDPDPRFQPVPRGYDYPSLGIQLAPATPQLQLPWRTNPTPTPPLGAEPLLAIIARLSELTCRLRQLNDDGTQCLTDVIAWTGTVRALRGIAQLMAESFRSFFGAQAPADLLQHVDRFARRARELHDAMSQAVDLTNPLPTTHPTLVHAQERNANYILDIFRDAAHVSSVGAFCRDRTIPTSWKYGCLTELYSWIGKACQQVELTSYQGLLANEIETGLYTQNDNLIAAVRSSLPIAELDNSFPAHALIVKQASLAILNTYARRQFAEIVHSRDRCRSYAHELVNDFLTLMNLEQQRRIVRQAVSSGIRADMEQARTNIIEALAARAAGSSGSLADRRNISAALENGPLIASAVDLLSYAAAFLVVASGPPASSSNTDGLWAGLNERDPAEAPVTIFGSAPEPAALTAGRTLSRVARWGGRGLARVARELSRPALRQALLQTAELARRVGTCAKAVVSVFAGVRDITTGQAQGDDVVVVVGTLRILSGVAIAAGLVFRIASANPIGAALGHVATAIQLMHRVREERVPYSQLLCESMVRYLRNHRIEWDNAVLLERLGLEPQMTALIQAAERNNWWRVSRTPLAGHNMSDAWRTRLLMYGFHEDQLDAIMSSTDNGPTGRSFHGGR